MALLQRPGKITPIAFGANLTALHRQEFKDAWAQGQSKRFPAQLKQHNDEVASLQAQYKASSGEDERFRLRTRLVELQDKAPKQHEGPVPTDISFSLIRILRDGQVVKQYEGTSNGRVRQ